MQTAFSFDVVTINSLSIPFSFSTGFASLPKEAKFTVARSVSVSLAISFGTLLKISTDFDSAQGLSVTTFPQAD